MARLRWLMVLGTVVLVVLHLWSSAHVPDPTVVFDENGYLGSARWLSGGPTWEMPFAPAYSSAYSLALTPVMALTNDPSAQWIGVRLVNAALLASVFPLLFVVLRQVLEVSRERAIAAAFVGSLIPATFSAGMSGIAENLVLPLVPASILAIWWMLDPGRHCSARVLAGPLVALLYATHPRFTFAVGVMATVLVWTGVRGILRPRVALANGAGLALGVLLSVWLDDAVQTARWHGTERLEGGIGDWVDLLTSTDGVRELALAATGQLWYLAVGSLGLGLVGVASVARRTATARAASNPEPERAVVLATMLALAGSVFATSVFFFAQNQFRPDHFVYGRHNDSFSTLWISIAVALLLDRAAHRRAVALTAAAAGSTLLLGLVLAASRGSDLPGVDFSPFAVPALTRLVEPELTGSFVGATAVSVAGSCLIAMTVGWVGRSRPWAKAGRGGLCVALGVWFTFLGLGTVFDTADFHEVIYDNWDPVPTIERVGIDELCIDEATARGSANLFYGWALAEVTIRSPRERSDTAKNCTFTLAPLGDGNRLAAADRVVLLDEGGAYPSFGLDQGAALWVAPGAVADRLDELGALLPEDFPGPLPASAREAAIAIEGGSSAPNMRVEAGRSIELDLSVAHQGTGSPWPDRASYGRDGHVELLAQFEPTDGSGPVVTVSAAALPGWMWPGDVATTTAALFAVDETLSPLPPGRYEVQLGVGQIGHEWFASGGSEAAFEIEVTI